jgi:hypothetical protein
LTIQPPDITPNEICLLPDTKPNEINKETGGRTKQGGKSDIQGPYAIHLKLLKPDNPNHVQKKLICAAAEHTTGM